MRAAKKVQMDKRGTLTRYFKKGDRITKNMNSYLNDTLTAHEFPCSIPTFSFSWYSERIPNLTMPFGRIVKDKLLKF